jgi:Mg-chelatase subunit ChlD
MHCRIIVVHISDGRPKDETSLGVVWQAFSEFNLLLASPKMKFLFVSGVRNYLKFSTFFKDIV